jgi:hypothetical protein
MVPPPLHEGFPIRRFKLYASGSFPITQAVALRAHEFQINELGNVSKQTLWWMTVVKVGV